MSVEEQVGATFTTEKQLGAISLNRNGQRWKEGRKFNFATISL